MTDLPAGATRLREPRNLTKCDVLLVEEGGHMVPYEQTAEVAEALRKFFG